MNNGENAIEWLIDETFDGVRITNNSGAVMTNVVLLVESPTQPMFNLPPGGK